jgi:hypothetical protein
MTKYILIHSQDCQNGQPEIKRTVRMSISFGRPHATFGCQRPVCFTPHTRFYLRMELRIRADIVLPADGKTHMRKYHPFAETRSSVCADIT